MKPASPTHFKSRDQKFGTLAQRKKDAGLLSKAESRRPCDALSAAIVSSTASLI